MTYTVFSWTLNLTVPIHYNTNKFVTCPTCQFTSESGALWWPVLKCQKRIPIPLLFHAGQTAIKLPSAEASKRAQCTSRGRALQGNNENSLELNTN